MQQIITWNVYLISHSNYIMSKVSVWDFPPKERLLPSNFEQHPGSVVQSVECRESVGDLID